MVHRKKVRCVLLSIALGNVIAPARRRRPRARLVSPAKLQTTKPISGASRLAEEPSEKWRDVDALAKRKYGHHGGLTHLKGLPAQAVAPEVAGPTIPSVAIEMAADGDARVAYGINASGDGDAARCTESWLT